MFDIKSIQYISLQQLTFQRYSNVAASITVSISPLLYIVWCFAAILLQILFHCYKSVRRRVISCNIYFSLRFTCPSARVSSLYNLLWILFPIKINVFLYIVKPPRSYSNALKKLFSLPIKPFLLHCSGKLVRAKKTVYYNCYNIAAIYYNTMMIRRPSSVVARS